jgi:cystathionine beta-lyase
MPSYKHTVFQTLSDELADRTITCTAPSKTFNLAGMGISNIIIKNPVIKEKFIQEINNVSGFPFSILGYKACELAYTKAENWLEEFITVIDENQKIVKEFFEKNYPEIKAPLIEGTYLQWIDFRALGMDPKKMADFMTNEAQLFLDEGYIFGKSGEGYERINLAAPSWVIKAALERLDKALKKL